MPAQETLSLLDESPMDRAIELLHHQTALYTAEPVVDELLDGVGWPHRAGILVDTSCGDGAFVVAALRRLIHVKPDADAALVLDRLNAWEIHPVACAQARARVSAVLSDAGWETATAFATARSLVRQGDFLTQAPGGRRYSLIVGNPPYLRAANVPAVLRSEYESVLPPCARADMMHMFLYRCWEQLLDEGEIAMVVSDRLLINDNASELRRVLGTRLGVSSVYRLDKKSAFYSPKQRKAGTGPRVHPVAIVLRDASRCAMRLEAAPLYLDGSDAGWANTTLGEIANVSLAPWLGTKGVFVIDQDTAKSLPEDSLVPAVDTDDMRAGVLRPATRFAIRTQPDLEPVGAVREHLHARIAGLPERARRGRSKLWWMPPERFDHLDLSCEALVVPRITQKLRSVRVPPGVLVINHNLYVVRSANVALEQIEQAMRDERAIRWIEDRASRLENNFLGISTGLLRKLPLSVAR